MEVAVVHDRLCNKGGGEKVAMALAETLGSDLYVAKYDPDKSYSLNGSVGELTEVNPMPDMEWDKYYALVRMLDAGSFAQEEKLEGYDAVWMSGMWAPFAARNNPNNILYCHSPNRALYDLAEEIRSRYEGVDIFWRPLFDLWRWFWEKMDKKAVEHLNRIVCNSENVQNRINKYWNRDAEVLYPPVDMENFYFEEFGDFWLSVNRMMKEKRIEIQLDAFEQLEDEKLVIVGEAEYGTEYQKEMEKRIDNIDNVEWKGRVSSEELFELYATCKGVIQTSIDEDFGLIPPESFSSGHPCLAVNEGGFRESIKNGETGILIDEPYAENLTKEIKNFDSSSFNPNYLQRYAEKFSRKRFEKRVRKITKEVSCHA